MRSKAWLISSIILLLSACAHGDAPKVDEFFNDPASDGFEWRHANGKQDFLPYSQSEQFKIIGFRAEELGALIDYYNAQIKFWKSKCQNQTQ